MLEPERPTILPALRVVGLLVVAACAGSRPAAQSAPQPAVAKPAQPAPAALAGKPIGQRAGS